MVCKHEALRFYNARTWHVSPLSGILSFWRSFGCASQVRTAVRCCGPGRWLQHVHGALPPSSYQQQKQKSHQRAIYSVSVKLATFGRFQVQMMSALFLLSFYATYFNPLNSELNPICYLLALLGAHHFLHVSWIRVKLLTFRLLMSYICSTHSWCF